MIAGACYLLSFLILLNCLLYFWRSGNSRNIIFAILLLTLSIHAFLEGAFHSGDMIFFPYLLGTGPLITALLFLLFTLYLNVSVKLENKWKNLYWIFILYVVIELAMLVTALFQNSGNYNVIYEAALQNRTSIYFHYKASYYLQFFFILFLYPYAIIFVLRNLSVNKSEKKAKLKIIKTLLLFILSIGILGGNHIYGFISYGSQGALSIPKHKLFTILAAWLGLVYMQIWPFFFKNKLLYYDLKTFGIRPYSITTLNESKEDMIRANLNHLIHNENIYKVEDLTLSMLATAIGISSHQLSEYLNKNEEKSFFNFINEQRISEAKKLLLKKERSVTEICYEVGFNTSATFYKAFKHETGLSPSKWRKNYLFAKM